ncbi:MAG: biopolymer transporter ExbD [Chromatiales bacterium]|nr:biopolymer transporter ExbD [Chromatiales bacterium]
MKLARRRKEEPQLNITPLIDVVFLLLIFFMVSTTFDKEKAIEIELPTASSSEEIKDIETLEITIDTDGRYFVNDAEVLGERVETLKLAIRKAVGDRDNLPVVINADGRAPHQSVIGALEAAGQLGFTAVSFATQPKPEKD